MKVLAISILSFFGAFGVSQFNEVNLLLDQYMEWTQTGESDLGKALFDAEVELTYQTGEEEMLSAPFNEYRSKVESAATSVARTMAVIDFSHSGNKAKAYLTDQSDEGDFSLVHRLELRKRGSEWSIYAISIIDKP